MNYLNLTLIHITLMVAVACGFMSDLNGTVPKQKPTDESRKKSNFTDEAEQRMLDFFGFKKRPIPKKNLHISRIMQHLYKSHMGDFFDGPKQMKDVWEVGFDLPPDHVTGRVNTARSFHHIGEVHVNLNPFNKVFFIKYFWVAQAASV